VRAARQLLQLLKKYVDGHCKDNALFAHLAGHGTQEATYEAYVDAHTQTHSMITPPQRHPPRRPPTSAPITCLSSPLVHHPSI
jgi:hypothetical protein